MDTIDNTYLKSKLTNEELLLVNSEVEKDKKSTAAAYLLWFFLGSVGGHRYYFGKTGSAIAMTLIVAFTLGFGAIITGIWALVDVFSINKWLRTNQAQLEHKVLQMILIRKESSSPNATSEASDTSSNSENVDDFDY